MKVVCICVTEDRPAFMPWLAWNFMRQTYQDKQLLVIDSSKDPVSLDVPSCHHAMVQPGTEVSEKRNLGISMADGDLIAWMDDDDWQHPRRLEKMVEIYEGMKNPAIVGTAYGWFYNLADGRCRMHMGREIISNSCIIPASLAKSVRLGHDPAADTPWMRELVRISPPPRHLSWPAHAWLSHDRNLSNPAQHIIWKSERLQSALGEAWGQETESQLDDLRERLGWCTCRPNPYPAYGMIRAACCPVHRLEAPGRR